MLGFARSCQLVRLVFLLILSAKILFSFEEHADLATFIPQEANKKGSTVPNGQIWIQG